MSPCGSPTSPARKASRPSSSSSSCSSLRNHGILQSRKGKGGGYLLARAPADIHLGQIVRLFDGPLAPVPCASQTAYVPCADCPTEAVCGVHLAMVEVRDATAKVLDGMTIASLLRKVERAAPHASHR